MIFEFSGSIRPCVLHPEREPELTKEEKKEYDDFIKRCDERAAQVRARVLGIREE